MLVICMKGNPKKNWKVNRENETQLIVHAFSCEELRHKIRLERKGDSI